MRKLNDDMGVGGSVENIERTKSVDSSKNGLSAKLRLSKNTMSEL